MNTTHTVKIMRRQFGWFALAPLLSGSYTAAFAAEYLDLAQDPLFSGTNAPPNVMVAVDDSGSMDEETLFRTDEGMLYWRNSTASATDSSGNFYDSGDHKYGYVFPFDQIQANPDNPNANNDTLTIAPIPELAYARSAEYNKAYFNPATDYSPWLKDDGTGDKRPDEEPKEARYDPQDTRPGPFDLTSQKSGNFYLERGMVIPGGGDVGNDDATYVCRNGSGQTYPANDIEIRFGFCYQRGFFSGYQLVQSDSSGEAPDKEVDQAGVQMLPYFPATFYLRESTPLPQGYGFDSSKTIEGKGPNGETLVGYEIRPENFTGGESGDAYKNAIKNFANWFTYHRKRHLATRGGIVAAFDRISDIRVGSCTINNRKRLKMKDLNELEPRAQFYSDIFNIDYSQNRGTPNRQALQHLGQQLEGKNRGDLPSIITAPCQRNFAILFTDGYSNPDENNGVGNIDGRGNFGAPFTDSRSNTIADIAMKYYSDLDTPINGILRVPEACDEPNPPKRLNCETDLHMTTFGVTLNQIGTIYNVDAFDAENRDPYTNFPAWPNVNNGRKGKEQVDDLWHATINSRGELLNAETPNEIADRFTTALQKILGEEGSGTSVSLNSASLTANSVAYQARFTAGAWSGELLALPQLSDGAVDEPDWRASELLSDPATPGYVAPDQRVILTRTAANCGNNNRKTVPFRYEEIKSNCRSQLSEEKVKFLRGDPAQERANDGDLRNRNGNVLGDIVHSSPLYVGAPNRIRYPNNWDDLLTDTEENTAEDAINAGYNEPGGFAQGPAKDRPAMIYVGANDGMLHGFDATSGQERIAYIPGNVLGGLEALTKSGYSHRYYVDATPISGDVIIDGQWRTALVGGLGGGGRSVYALDVTDPTTFSEDNTETVLWEFEDSELGHVYGQPSIIRLHDGRWAAVFGNGYNSERGSAQLFIVDIATGDLIRRIDTGARPSTAPDPCAIQVGLGGLDIGLICGDGDDDGDDDNGRVTICHQGNKTQSVNANALSGHLGHGDTLGACNGEKKIPVCHRGKDEIFTESKYFNHIDHTTLGECGETDDDRVNGLGEVFPVDLDGDFITDYIYAGDLYGNVWKFDLTGQSKNDWEVAFNGQPLFTATDASGNPQSITTQPQVGVHPYGSRYGVMVYFGTGKYLETADRDAKIDQQNSFYGIWDLDVFTFNNANGGRGTFNTSLKSDIPRSRLQEQTITETTLKNGDTYRLVSDNQVDYQTESDPRGSMDKRGWFIDLDAEVGELSVSNSRIEGNTIAFSTTIPNTEVCRASGSGYFMLLDRGTGGRTDYPAFDLNGDRKLNENDTFMRDGNQVGASGLLIAEGIPGQASHQTDVANDTAYYIVPASDGTMRMVYTQREPDRRRSWREIRR